MSIYDNIQPNNAGQAFTNAFQQGQQQRRQAETQNALSKYAMDSNNPETMQGLARFNPQLAIQLQERQRQEAMRGLEHRREDIITGGKIFRQVQPKDQATYDQARQMAAQMGVDLSGVPPQFDPKYVQGIVGLADAMDPQKQSQDRFIPLQPGGSLARIGQDGQPQIVFQQNDGSHPIGAPAQQAGNMPQPGQVEDGYRFKGGNPADPNSWEPVNGGPTPQASGGFPPGGY